MVATCSPHSAQARPDGFHPVSTASPFTIVGVPVRSDPTTGRQDRVRAYRRCGSRFYWHGGNFHLLFLSSHNYLLILFLLQISGAVYWHRQYRFMAMVRGTLTTAVYQKALQMNISASTNAKTLTLMSADCERITRGLMDLHELWANLTQVALATWLIETQLGVACVAPIAVTLRVSSPDLFHLR